MASELPNYIEDDWGDNALSGRSSASKGVYYNYHAGGTGDLLKGVYRPVWEVESGSPVAENGILNLKNDSGATSTLAVPAALAVGSWSFDWKLTNTSITDSVDASISLLSQNTQRKNNEYRLTAYFADTGEDAHLQHWDSSGANTTLVTWSPARDTSWHTYRATRDSYSAWEAFADGTSQGTATDTSLTSGQYLLVVGHGGDVDMYADNLVVQ